MNVKEVLNRLRQLGLDVSEKTAAGHYKVYDPKTGARLFDVSGTPSDPNWYHQVSRDLRRMGLSLDASKVRRKAGVGKHPAVDLEALRRAQEAAREAGEREPQLSDLDEAPSSSPLWKRVKGSGGNKTLNSEAQQEVITNMVARADTGRVKYVRGRLENFMMEKGDELRTHAKQRYPNTPPGKGQNAEFARIAIYEVAPARNMRAWKTEGAATQAVGKFIRDGGGLSIWALALIEATMDHMNGMKWGTYEIPEPDKYDGGITVGGTTHKPPFALEGVTAEEAEKELEVEAEKIAESYAEDEPVEPDPKEWSRSPVRELPTYKERYIEQLLKMLESGKHSDEVIVIEVMGRLDKLLLEDS